MDLTTNYIGLTLPTPIIAGSSGLTSSVKRVKALPDNGAGAVQVASCLYKNGPQHLKELLDGLGTWMTTKRYGRLADFRGRLSQERSADPAVYGRAQFMRYFGGKKSVIL